MISSAEGLLVFDIRFPSAYSDGALATERRTRRQHLGSVVGDQDRVALAHRADTLLPYVSGHSQHGAGFEACPAARLRQARRHHGRVESEPQTACDGT